MGKALTSASNPGEPSDRLGKHRGRSKAECGKSPKRESERRGAQKKTKNTTAQPTVLNSCRMRKQPEPVVHSGRAASGDTRGAPAVGLPWEPLGTRWAQAALHPGAGCQPPHGSAVLIPPRQPASREQRASLPGTGTLLAQQRGRMGAHPDPVEGLTRPAAASSPPSPLIYGWSF